MPKSNLIIKTYTTNDSWTCPAGVNSITIIPKIKKTTLVNELYNPFLLSSSGYTYTWGSNTNGKLGTNDILAKSSPTLVVGNYKFQQVFATGNAGCSFGLTSDGTTYSWGDNTNGQLGDNTADAKSSPVPVVGGYKFQQLFPSIHSKGSHFGILADSSLYSWGYNAAGQLGTADVTSRSSPTPVVGSYKFKKIMITYEGTSTSSSIVGLLSDGTAYAWGSNTYGQLGTGDRVARSSPTLVLGGYKFEQVTSTSNSNFFGLTSDGTAYAWGYNFVGQLGIGSVFDSSSPTLVLGGLKFKQINLASNTIFGLLNNGTLYAWGSSTFGLLGNNTSAPSMSSPIPVLGGYKFKQIYGGAGHVMGLATNENIYTWGDNTYGQLGDGTAISKSSPTLVIGAYTFKQIVAGIYGYNSYGITTEGKVYSWGYNTDGELGDNSIVVKSSPVLVVGGNIIDFSTDDSRINTYSVVPGTTYQIVLTVLPTFGNNTISTLSLDSLTIQYYI